GHRRGEGRGGEQREGGGEGDAFHGESPGVGACLLAAAGGMPDYSIRAASSKPSRGERGKMLARSPWPRLTRKLDLTSEPLKKASSTLSVSKPDIGPVSRPSARAAMIR